MQLINNKIIGIRCINGDDNWVMCREESKTAMFPPYRWEISIIGAVCICFLLIIFMGIILSKNISSCISLLIRYHYNILDTVA